MENMREIPKTTAMMNYTFWKIHEILILRIFVENQRYLGIPQVVLLTNHTIPGNSPGSASH